MQKTIKQVYVVPVVAAQCGVAANTLGFPGLSGEPMAGYQPGF
jgi:hypothetical protein